MKTNKLKVLVISAIGLLALTACGNEVKANPTDYNDPQITINEYDKTVYNNVMSVIYDAIREGGIGPDVQSQILKEFAKSIIGDFNSLKEAAIGNSGVVDDFVRTHKAYWTLNADGKREGGEDAPASESEKARVTAKYETILKRIATTMYDKISSGSYSERNYFSEAEFLRSLRTSLKKVADPNDAGTQVYEPKLLLPSVEPENVFKEGGFLHEENYFSTTNTYVETDVLPDIYKELLTEQYLVDSTYNTLGRSYARKVNIIEIQNNSNNPFAAKYLADNLINEISTAKIAAPTPSDASDALLERFKVYDRAMVGAALSETSDEYKLLTSGDLPKQFKLVTEEGNFQYFTSTDYGDLMSKYKKINPDPQLTDTSIENEFTGNGAYVKEQGLQIKTDELRLKDHTTTGWFIKNGGLTELPDEIRTRLFNISVANGVIENKEEAAKLDRIVGEDYKVPEDESAYIARINGRNFLKKASRVEGEKEQNDILFHDSGNGSYYIVEVQEAVSSTKLSKSSSSENNYYNARANDVEKIINNVSEIVGKSESYSAQATEYYIKQMAIIFHDDDVYEYFKATYPDLFK